MNKKNILLICIIALMLVSIETSVNVIGIKNKQLDIITSNTLLSNFGSSYTNLTVQEAWGLLNDTSNGIHIPIDVRRIDEWRAGRIDTPFPEHPRWYPLDLLMNDSILPKFLFQYHKCNIILYCKGGYRSFLATKILIANNFTGNISNMVGGITEWNGSGYPTIPGGIYNLNINQTTYLCNDTLNGVQNPIDVRRIDEWNDGFIDTPWPECPIWYTLDLLKNDSERQKFKKEYIGNEIILYCKGGYRSLLGNFELWDDNFTGTQYNMLGGITEWEKYFPVRDQSEPNAPVIKGPIKVRKETDVNYTFTSIDPEDDVVWYWINWGDGCPNVEWIGPYASGNPIIVNHSFLIMGTYNITAKAKDFYGNISDLGSLVVQVPKTFTSNFNLLEWLFEQFPLLDQLILTLINKISFS